MGKNVSNKSAGKSSSRSSSKPANGSAKKAGASRGPRAGSGSPPTARRGNGGSAGGRAGRVSNGVGTAGAPQSVLQSSVFGAAPNSVRSKHTSDLHRLLKIIVLAQSGPGWKAAKLADECKVVVRTIYRDVNKLVAVGVPIEHDEAWGGYRVRGEFFLPPVQLSSEEAIALAVLCEEVAGREQIGFLSPALRGLQKLQAQLPAEMRDEILRKSKHVTIRTAQHVPSADHVDVFTRVSTAINTGKALECEYDKAGSGNPVGEPFVFEPYALHYNLRAWYAVGRHTGRQGLRCLKLTRFLRVTPTVRSYTIPPAFTIDKYLRNAWSIIPGDQDYDVEIAFDSGLAQTVIETMWHPTQRTEEHADGGATFRCRVSGLDEILWWVLSMGNKCRVVNPPELAQRVAEEAKKVAALYE